MRRQQSGKSFVVAGRLVLGALAVLGVPAPGAAQHEGHGAPKPATAHAHEPHGQAPQPADAAPAAVAVEFSLGSPAPIEREEVELRVRLTDRQTRQPVTGLNPMGWIDVRQGAHLTSREVCRQRVGAFLDGMMQVRHGQGYTAQPVDDLTDHYLLAMSRGAQILVIDPVRGFGRTRLLTTVPLESPGEDWVESSDGRRLFVSLPRVGKVAVVGTHRWKVEAAVATGGSPGKVVFQPGERYLWTFSGAAGESPAGVVVIDAASLKVAARISTGAGPHAVAFSSDGKLAFVANRAAGTLSVIDLARLAKLKDIPTGPQPVDVAYSSRTGRVYVAHAADGSVAALDAQSLEVVERIPFKAGIQAFRIAPRATAGHHHTGPVEDGPFAFVLNPGEGTVEVYDLVERKRIRTLTLGQVPDQVSFTGSFAYIRSAGTAEVVMVPLHDPTQGGDRPHDKFPAGGAAPGAVAEKELGQLVVPMPHMGDGVYVANPAERMIYSYHYMEGMPIPHNGLTTYGYDIRAVRTSSRRMREVEPGLYAAVVRLERAGNYDLMLRVPEHQLNDCLGFNIHPDPKRLAAGVDIRPLQPATTLRVGENRLAFRIVRPEQQTPLTALEDVRFRIAAPGGWQRHVTLRPADDGTYVADVSVPATGVYYLAFEIPSLGIGMRDRSPLVLRATDGD